MAVFIGQCVPVPSWTMVSCHGATPFAAPPLAMNAELMVAEALLDSNDPWCGLQALGCELRPSHHHA